MLNAGVAMVPTGAAVTRGTTLRVLLVDDSEPDAFLIERGLVRSSLPCIVESTKSAEEALFLLSSNRFDAAFIDQNLGAMTGLDLIQRARRRGATGSLILVTGLLDPSTEMSALDHGASDFIAKEDISTRVLERVLRYNVQRARQAQDVALAKQRLEAFIVGSNDGFWDWNLGTGTVYFSLRFLQMLGSTAPCNTLESWMTYVDERDRQYVREALRNHAFASSPRLDIEYRVRHTDGGHRWMHLRGVAQRSASGRLERIAGAQSDITSQKEREEASRRRALQDGLTKVLNRDGFNEGLAGCLARARTYGEGFCVVFFDLDNFKGVNDAHGHGVGDDVLREVGQRMRDSLAPKDSIARIGGDEFVLLVRGNPSEAEARRVAARIEARVGAPIEISDGDVTVSMSWGVRMVSTWEDPKVLLAEADAAMYADKVRRREQRSG